ncbi:MAG TPA: hypothetical protein VG649_22550 [Candidatus Angelobacter sp.]|jgi:hypothetical protein|nr:hypothetical protein [Candidatus Angelobacter sp.]
MLLTLVAIFRSFELGYILGGRDKHAAQRTPGFNQRGMNVRRNVPVLK